MPVTDSELRAQADQVRITQSTLPLARQPRKRTLSLRLNALNLQAAPGPSGARNGLIRGDFGRSRRISGAGGVCDDVEIITSHSFPSPSLDICNGDPN